ncbi:MAG: hypothetical protein NC180_09440 [Muribaculaceae bacterium]|nr:hypothetical protein [Roseburia sp.]MCM1431871.1 hypothetical protein [Muribaculaceae bacterium]MCM1493431.1 hypothetical protein [Muribaculaceae bacterium]
MLPQISLDDQSFRGLVEQETARIADLYPAWTDHNSHDPGITLLELFAWLTEQQQFHMDQIGREHILRYLRLLGITPGNKRAASVMLSLSAGEPHFLPKGSRFFAGDVCFELAASARVGESSVVRLVSHRGNHRRTAAVEAFMHFPAFGDAPAPGDSLWIGMTVPLGEGVRSRLAISLAKPECGTRNPIPESCGFYPLAELVLECQTAEGCRECLLTKDTTHQLLTDGFLEFETPGRMEAVEDLYWLRLVVKRAEYDVPPVITGIRLGNAPALQQRTIVETYDGIAEAGELRHFGWLAMEGEYLLFEKRQEGFFRYGGTVRRRREDESALFLLPEKRRFAYRLLCYERGESLLLGAGSGLPRQEYPASFPMLCADGLALMAEVEKGSGCYLPYEPCVDFAEAGPEDAVFVFREAEGSFCFGDCVNGLAPEGEILLAAARQSLGAKGNVREGSIRTAVEPGVTVTNPAPAAGGREGETLEECRRRLPAADMHRAVTEEDFEALVLGTPGLLLESAGVVPLTAGRAADGSLSEERLAIVAKPASPEERPALSGAYRKNILKHLEPRRLLGTGITLLSPEYAGIIVYGEIRVCAELRTAEAELKEVLHMYFAGIRGSFGAAVRRSEIYGILDVKGTVAEILSLTLESTGRDIRRSKSGDLLLPANGLAYLKDCVLQISADR